MIVLRELRLEILVMKVKINKVIPATEENIKASKAAHFEVGGSKYVISATKLEDNFCLLYTSPSPRDKRQSRMPSSA